jgi:hypothetical protein
MGIKSKIGCTVSWLAFVRGLIPKSPLASAGSSGIVGGIAVGGRGGVIDFLSLLNSSLGG